MFEKTAKLYQNVQVKSGGQDYSIVDQLRFDKDFDATLSNHGESAYYFRCLKQLSPYSIPLTAYWRISRWLIAMPS